ncbi:MAG TPA: cell surface protein, partial [Planctomycetaceae bacterium]|nr:cell surface protein [Planctomycetaceae bacterium]
MVIPKNLTFEYPEQDGNTWIDELVDTKLKSLRIAPSNVCDDETFLRRVTIDLVGLLPTEEERDTFLANQSPDKRSQYVEQLLSRKEFV